MNLSFTVKEFTVNRCPSFYLPGQMMTPDKVDLVVEFSNPADPLENRLRAEKVSGGTISFDTR